LRQSSNDCSIARDGRWNLHVTRVQLAEDTCHFAVTLLRLSCFPWRARSIRPMAHRESPHARARPPAHPMPHPRLTRVALALLLGLALGAGGLAAMADPPRTGAAPDPPAQASRKQWTFDVSAQNGKVSVASVKATMFEKPAESPRVMGRFALELYVGPQLLDRVRFNLPLMDAPRPDTDHKRLPRPSFDQITTRIHVRMADNPRAAYLLLVDRATDEAQRFDWPPQPDGRLVPWKEGRLTKAGPGDVQGNKLTEVKEGGAPPPPPPARDAGRD